MLFKNYPSPSPRILKVPVNRRFAGVFRGQKDSGRFTLLSQNLHLTFTRSWWKIGERYVKANLGCGLAKMPLYRAFAPIAVKVKDTFWKVLARDAPSRANIIYAQEIGWYISILACLSHETAVPAKKWYDFSKSGTTFSHISCIRRKFSRELCAYQLFPSLYQLFSSPGTSIARMNIGKSKVHTGTVPLCTFRL